MWAVFTEHGDVRNRNHHFCPQAIKNPEEFQEHKSKGHSSESRTGFGSFDVSFVGIAQLGRLLRTPLLWIFRRGLMIRVMRLTRRRGQRACAARNPCDVRHLGLFGGEGAIRDI